MTACSHLVTKEDRIVDGKHQAVRRCADCDSFIAWVEKKPGGDVHAIVNRLRVMLAGPLFEPKAYGDDKIWDDSKFFKDMLRMNGQWSPKQEELIKRRFAVYDKFGSQLKPKESPQQPVTKPAPPPGVPHYEDIPF